MYQKFYNTQQTLSALFSSAKAHKAVFRLSRYALVLCLLVTVILSTGSNPAEAVVAQSVSLLNASVSGPRNTSGQISLFGGATGGLVSPLGIIPAQLSNGGYATFSVILHTDAGAASWTVNPQYVTVSFTDNSGNKQGAWFQDNNNGAGTYCFIDLHEPFVNNDPFQNPNAKCHDHGTHGSTTLLSVQLFKDGSTIVSATHLDNPGLGTDTFGPLSPALFPGFNPNTAYYPRIRVVLGADTGQAWHVDLTNATLTATDAAAFTGGGTGSSQTAQFFNPGDGRLCGLPGDRVAIYFYPPDKIVVYGVADDQPAWNMGFLLTTFSYKEVMAAGKTGQTKLLGNLGGVSLAIDEQNNFWLSWAGGGKYRASGQVHNGFAKGCKLEPSYSSFTTSGSSTSGFSQ